MPPFTFPDADPFVQEDAASRKVRARSICHIKHVAQHELDMFLIMIADLNFPQF